jgi:hypothetical protein
MARSCVAHGKEVNTMRTELSITELEAESVQLLPSRETLFFNTNWANVVASNSSMALNAASLNSWATSTATQNINVTQLSN